MPARAVPGTITQAYPIPMLRAGINGEVDAEFIVDTFRRAEPASLKIVRSTDQRFTEAVRDALPRMRFTPAGVQGHKVKQIVQQAFTFNVNQTRPPNS